jgi:hypothetical protein
MPLSSNPESLIEESISTDMSASVQECDRELGFQQLTLPPADSLSDAASRRSFAPRSMSTTAHAIASKGCGFSSPAATPSLASLNHA